MGSALWRRAHRFRKTPLESLASSTHVDRALGIRETVSFLDTEEGKMFSCLHSPLGEAIGGLLICPSIHAEFLRNYRREVLVARAMAVAGVTVQRFHYLGTGNSDGEESELTFNTMVRDAVTAANRLKEACGISRLGFLGARFGGLIGASAAARFPGAPLILWQPALLGESYLNEVLRYGAIRSLRISAESGEASIPTTDELMTNGVIDILGYPIRAALHDSARERNLEEELGNDARALLILQLNRRKELASEWLNIKERLTQKGFRVQASVIQDTKGWWFDEGTWEAEERRAGTVAAVELSSQWLLACFIDSRRAHYVD
jgi:hypothetical protein